MIRVVVDSSVFLRYLLKPSRATRVLVEDLWLGDRVQLVTASELIRELDAVLRRDSIQALIRPEEGEILLDTIRRKAEVLGSQGPCPSFTRNPKDDKFVACALAGEAGYLVTEDRDLLVLAAAGSVRVVIPYEFMRPGGADGVEGRPGFHQEIRFLCGAWGGPCLKGWKRPCTRELVSQNDQREAEHGHKGATRPAIGPCARGDAGGPGGHRPRDGAHLAGWDAVTRDGLRAHITGAPACETIGAVSRFSRSEQQMRLPRPREELLLTGPRD